MYFYVDESGNTGSHLFDPKQPNLYYGVIGCRKNLDVVAEPMLARLRANLSVTRLHAQHLGAGRLIPVAQAFTAFQKKHDVRFSFYTVAKADHAVVCFFDQVFDSGMNEAVPWHHYWTPLRYFLLIKVAYLFDEGLCARAWDTRLEQNPTRCAEKLVALCNDLRARVGVLPDAKSRQIINDALVWAAARPGEISFGASNQESALQISPNIIGFQQVLQGIAQLSARTNRDVRSIIVDRQNEFNTAQGFLADMYSRLRGKTFKMPPGMPDYDWTNMPATPPKFVAGDCSGGLEMTDVYLWTMKRAVENYELPPELHRMLHGQRHRGRTDEISLRGIERRWRHLLDLPDPTPEQAEKAAEYVRMAEEKHQKAMDALAG
jgi:hypothetical protein